MLAREQAVLGRAASLTAPDIVNLFARCDAWRKPARFAALLAAASVTLARDQAGTAGAGWHACLAAALARVRAIDAGAIAGRCGADKAQIAPALQQARVDVVAQFLAQAE
jgi:tRNA nucleotidyltransferase (CCA-adding enzyme)